MFRDGNYYAWKYWGVSVLSKPNIIINPSVLMEEFVMEWDSLNIALIMLPELEDIVIQTRYGMDVPYIKRKIIQTLGEPNKMIGNEITYYIGKIRIVSGEDFDGYDADKCFYVGRGDDLDDVVYFPRLQYPAMGHELSMSDKLNLLLRDGWQYDLAIKYVTL